MKYTVLRAFTDVDGTAYAIGNLVELERGRATRMQRSGLIGPPSAANLPAALESGIVEISGAKTTSREENIAGLSSAVALANGLKTSMNAHYADAADHTTAVDAANTIVAPLASDITSLIALVTAEMASYVLHDDDAELAAAWAYHAAQEAGNHSLASVVAPINLQECITKLNDLKTKFNAHDADATAHGVGSQHQEAAAAGAYGVAIRVALGGVLQGDQVAWGILNGGTGTVVGVSAAAGLGFVDFTFDADPQNDAVISYLVAR